MVKAAGTVYKNGRERADLAVVKATPEVGSARFAATDDDGDFSFDDLAPGTWTIVAMDEEYHPSPPQTTDLQQDKTDYRFELRRRMATPDERLGNILLRSLIGALAVLAAVYVALHALYPPVEEPLGTAVIEMTEQVLRHQALQPTDTVDRPSQSPDLVAKVSQLESSLNSVLAQTPQAMSPQNSRALTNVVNGIKAAVAADNKVDAVSGLEMLQRLLKMPAQAQFLWTQGPWRYVEALLWAVAGVLVYLIMTVATYLRWGRFYREGLYFLAAQVATVPLVSLITVLLLSLMTISVTIGGNQVQLDLKDPQVLIVVSFLIALRPWELWSYVRTASARLTGDDKPPGN